MRCVNYCKGQAIFLLVFLGIGGIYGGWMLISDPSGGKFQWSPDLLEGTPFNSFLIPGFVLAVVNGLLPLCIATLTILKKKYTSWLITLQGIVLFGWLTSQLVFNPEFFTPQTHYPTFSIAFLLVATGALMLIIPKKE